VTTKTGTRLSIFPLAQALLLPGGQLPLHIFEPRYRALVSDSLARDRRIAMIQPLPVQPAGTTEPALFEIGCVGRIAEVEALLDGRFNLILEGLSRFRILRELETQTLFRQVEADLEIFDEAGGATIALPSIIRAEIEREARRFAERHGFAIDWESVARLDDEALVNGLAQAIPFDIAIKQALLEAPTVYDRADLIAEFLRFGAGDTPTIQ
jgi:Lon protease-like protein